VTCWYGKGAFPSPNAYTRRVRSRWTKRAHWPGPKGGNASWADAQHHKGSCNDGTGCSATRAAAAAAASARVHAGTCMRGGGGGGGRWDAERGLLIDNRL